MNTAQDPQPFNDPPLMLEFSSAGVELLVAGGQKVVFLFLDTGQEPARE
jgi:hypothetical protein